MLSFALKAFINFYTPQFYDQNLYVSSLLNEEQKKESLEN